MIYKNGSKWEIKCIFCRKRTEHEQVVKNRFQCQECNQFSKSKGRKFLEGIEDGEIQL
jgi:hypothetical protein